MTTLRIEQQYSVSEVAKLLGIGPATVWRYVQDGKRTDGLDGIWPVYKLSHKVVRIPAGAVHRFLARRKA